MNIVEKLRLMQTDHIPELGEAIAEIEHLRREAHAWSKACEDATTKLYKLSTHHPRLEVRYWTGKYWEPLYGARFHEVLNALDLTPNEPVQVMGELVKCVTPGGLILDPFMGSASTGVAALQLGYRFIGIEKTAHYFDVACKRLERAVGGDLLPQQAEQQTLV
jgi:hypothetical protein